MNVISDKLVFANFHRRMFVSLSFSSKCPDDLESLKTRSIYVRGLKRQECWPICWMNRSWEEITCTGIAKALLCTVTPRIKSYSIETPKEEPVEKPYGKEHNHCQCLLKVTWSPASFAFSERGCYRLWKTNR